MAEGEGLVGVPANSTKERGPVAFEDSKRNGTSRRDDGSAEYKSASCTRSFPRVASAICWVLPPYSNSL